MSWLKDLPDLGTLLVDLSVSWLCFPFNIYYPFQYWKEEIFFSLSFLN